MKCKYCDGTGEIINDALRWTSCPVCGGKGYIKQTNEKWFCGLSTKKKAKVLDLLMDGMSNLRFEIEEILNNGDFDMTHEEAVEIWLKQPHEGD